MTSELHDPLQARKPPSDPGRVLMESATRTLTQPGSADTPPSSRLSASIASRTLSEPDPPPLEPPPLNGSIKHYEIIRKLGEGGMGIVLLARDTKLGRLVALKLLHGSGQAASRLLAEAQAIARARHDNIVVIYEVGELDRRPYMVLEYVEGRTLRQALSTGQPGEGRAVPRGFAVNIVISVVRGLAAAHKSGIVHLDLKPENIMLLDSGQVKLLDFGIARSVDSGEQSRLSGTRAYMAPEQWLGGPVDERSDLWAAGLILYELLAGAHPLAPLTTDRLESVLDLDTPMPSLRDARPELAGLSEVIGRCLCKRPEERFASADELLAALEPWVARSRSTSLGDSDSPFAGLAAFQESDADRFFGRERDVMAILGLLGRQALVAVAGTSGAGKSSFVRAGLIPAVKRSGEDCDVLVVRPGRSPLSALREAIAAEDIGGDLRSQPALFGALLRARCRARGAAQRTLVFVDQFEELYTLVPDAAERAAFLACLLGAADDASSPLRVVLAVRSDFLDRIVEDRHFMKQVSAGLFFLPPVDREGLRDALTRPVAAAGYRFESEAMIADMLDELSRAKSPLPLLQFSATKMWEARDRERMLLTQEAYEKVGGVAGALATHADTVVSGLSAPDQRLCRAIFLRLVTPERTRAIVCLRDLVALGGDAAAVEAVVQHLADARLLLVDADAEKESAKVELVHESLIERWPTLARWLDESAGDARFVALLRAAASQWEASGAPSGLLWRDHAAEEARAFYERHHGELAEARGVPLGALEERYLQAVIAFSKRARRRRKLQIAGAFAFVCAVAGVVFVLALRAQAQAKRADEEAARVRERNAELAFQALRGRNATRLLAARKRQDDPTLMLALLREVEPPDVPSDWPELVSAALLSGVASAVRHVGEHPVYDATVSPDGTRIALAMNDTTLRIMRTGDLSEIVTLRGHDEYVWTAAWSSDGKRVITASGDKTARIWNADGSGEPLVLRGHTADVLSAEISPDGERVLTGAEDGTARIWSARDGREISVLRPDAKVLSAHFSPDGRRFVTSTSDGIGRVWDADRGARPLLLRGHTDMIVQAAWSPDGARIATASNDRTVRVWDAQNGAELVVLRGHEDKVMNVAWSPDGQRIASASKDKTVRLWNADGKGDPIALRGHGHWVYSAKFSPDSRHLVTSSLDRSIRFWDLDAVVAPIVLRGHEESINDGQFSPDGKRFATASSDSTVRVWNADGAGEALVLRGHVGPVVEVSWSPDGARLVTASADGTARIWSLDGSFSPIVLRGNQERIHSVDWSPDGARVVTASRNGTLRLWGSDGIERARTTRPNLAPGYTIRVLFDASGRRVVSCDTGYPTLDVWDVDASGKISVLGRHDDVISFLVRGPDGHRFLTTSQDGTARIWDVRGVAEPIVLRASPPVRQAAWSPDGDRVAMLLEDGTVQIRSVDGAGAPLPRAHHRIQIITVVWSPDSTRIAYRTTNMTARVRNTDGSGVPFALIGAQTDIIGLSWSPDGAHIAVRSEERILRIWPDVRPFSGTDDARLWAATSYCISPSTRVELLGVTEAEAREAEEACRRRVAEARAAQPAR